MSRLKIVTKRSKKLEDPLKMMREDHQLNIMIGEQRQIGQDPENTSQLTFLEVATEKLMV